MGPLKLVPLGYQQIGASALANATALTVPAGANVAYVSVDTAPVRWRDDGTAPTASIGMQIVAAGVLEYWGDLGMIEFILASGSPVLNVSYYRIAG